MWARSAVTSPRGLILTRQVHFFRDVMMISLFTCVVGGDGYSRRLPRVRPDRVRCARSFLDGCDIFEVAVNRRRVCTLTFTSHSFSVRAAPAPSPSLRSPPLPFLLKLLTFHHSTPRVMAPKRKASEAVTSGYKEQEGCGCCRIHCHHRPEEG